MCVFRSVYGWYPSAHLTSRTPASLRARGADPLGEQSLLGGIVGECQRPSVCVARVVRAAEAAKELGADRVVQVVTLQAPSAQGPRRRRPGRVPRPGPSRPGSAPGPRRVACAPRGARGQAMPRPLLQPMRRRPRAPAIAPGPRPDGSPGRRGLATTRRGGSRHRGQASRGSRTRRPSPCPRRMVHR